VELRQLEAFVVVADELHFGRAAQRLHLGQPTLSDLIRRLERELGAPLFTRTTRRVVVTEAGAELLGRAKDILEEVAGARAAVQRLVGGDAGTVRLAVTPPVAPVLAPHLIAAFAGEAPDVDVVVRRMWLPELRRSIPDGHADVAITCGLLPEVPGLVNEVFCAEPLLVGLRPTHRLARSGPVALSDLRDETLGLHNDELFPAWTLAQRQVLESAGLAPPTVELDDIDLSAGRWSAQADVDWILTTAAISGGVCTDPLLPVAPPTYLPYTLQWCPIRAATAAVGRFVQSVLSTGVPAGWIEQDDHLRYDADEKRSATA
jgi:DNA-binding transcriptional LysR family regulator